MPSKEEFYCVRCRCSVKVDEKNIKGVVVYNNKKIKAGTPALKAVCNKCGTNLNRFIKQADKKMMEEKYGKCKK